MGIDHVMTSGLGNWEVQYRSDFFFPRTPFDLVFLTSFIVDMRTRNSRLVLILFGEDEACVLWTVQLMCEFGGNVLLLNINIHVQTSNAVVGFLL